MEERPSWTWSAAHNDHYHVTRDAQGNAVYVWSKEQSSLESQAQSPNENIGPQRDSHASGHGSSLPSRNDLPSHGYKSICQPQTNPPTMPPPIPSAIRTSLPGLVSGDPQRGWYEQLDPSYRMKPGYEAHQFFKKGRVFSVLWAESASETAARDAAPDGTIRQYRNPGYTPGRFGEIVFSNIRRFVIVRVKKREHFVYACPISTYGGRGTTKAGCNPREHAIAYFSGTKPQCLPGEYENGMTKDPIEIEPADPNEVMNPASRIRFGKSLPVEWNVKVKDVGMVLKRDLPKLLRYWKEEDFYDSDDGDGAEAREHDSLKTIKNRIVDGEPPNLVLPTQKRSSPYGEEESRKEAGKICAAGALSPSFGNNDMDMTEPRYEGSNVTISSHDNSDLALHMRQRVIESISPGPADAPEEKDGPFGATAFSSLSGCQVIRKPRQFFKKGRVFSTPWPLLQTEQSGEKTARLIFQYFAVVRPRATYCLCLSLSTYDGLATSGQNVAADDHAAVVSLGSQVQLHEREQSLTKPPIFVKVEEEGLILDPMLRINFAKVYTVEYEDAKVQNIGRVVPESLWQMDACFVECLRLDGPSDSGA